jgi:hypothetical protein
MPERRDNWIPRLIESDGAGARFFAEAQDAAHAQIAAGLIGEAPLTPDSSEQQIARWALRRILNKLAQLFALALPPAELDHRASGAVVCEVCGEEYRRHANDPHDPSGTTTMLCDGRRVHL